MASSVTRVTGMYSGLDTESLISQLTSKYTAKKDKIWKQQESLKYQQNAWKDLNKDIYNFYTKLSSTRLTSTYKQTSVTSSDASVATASGDRVTGTNNLSVLQTASNTFVTGDKVANADVIGLTGTVTVKIGNETKDLEITSNMSMDQVAKKLTNMGLIANFDADNARLFISSASTGAKSDFEFGGDAGLLSAMGLGSSANKQIGQDAIIELNGAQFTFDTNSFKINGMNITANSVGSTVIGTKTSDKVFDTVKDLIESYNTLIKKIDTAYYTNNSSYQPLTDDEKYVLSDKQVDEWEQKLKDGALYKDESLSDIRNILTNTMSSVSVGGKWLSSFGISMNSYFTSEKEERNMFQLDEDALRKAIDEDLDGTINFFTNLSAKLYENVDTKMKSTSYSSVYTVYNDKKMKTDLADYEQKLAEWEDRITAIEDKYYKKFSKMETMLSSLQSKNDYITSYFGG